MFLALSFTMEVILVSLQHDLYLRLFMVNQYAGEKPEVRLWVCEGINRGCGQQGTNKFDFIKGLDIMRIRKN